MKKQLLLVLLAGIVVLPAISQETSYEITSSDVTHFIKSTPEIKTDLEKLDIYGNWFNEDYTFAQNALTAEKVENVVQKHGYKDFVTFVQKLSAIGMAYSAVIYEKEMTVQQPEMQQALKEIEENESLTPEQKEAMKQMITQGMSAANQAFSSVPDKNKKAVEEHITELEELFDSL